MSIGISWLQAFPTINVLLDRHRATARVLGARPTREAEFQQAVESRGKGAQAFRGIPGLFSSPFEVAATGDFRGLKQELVRDDPDLSNPPFAPPAEKSVGVSPSEAEVDFSRASQVEPQDDLAFRQNEALAELFRRDAELRDAFISGDHLNIDEKLSQAAKEILGWSPDITEDFLREHPEEALLIAADLGNVSELLDDPDAAQALTGDVRERMEGEIYDHLAQKVTGLMKDSTLLNKVFFREHPRAALYLLYNPQERHRIDGNREAEEEFRDHVASYENQVDPAARAQALAGSNPALRDDFWKDNPGLALALCAEKAAGQSHSLLESALGYPRELHQETTPAEMVIYDQARRAARHFQARSLVNINYLREHPHLAQLINENPEFGEKLSRDSRVSDLLGAGDLRTERVLRAYVSGFAGRTDSAWQWWA